MANDKLELYQLEIQIVFKGSEKLIPLSSVKSDNRRKMEELQEDLHNAWADADEKPHRFGFQGENGVAIFIDMNEVSFLTTQLQSDTFKSVRVNV